MEKKYYEIKLSNDETRKFRVICDFTLLGIREIITNRIIAMKCSHDACINNYGLTCENLFIEVNKKEAENYKKMISSNKEVKTEYKEYLKEVEENSFRKYEDALIVYKGQKKRKRTR